MGQCEATTASTDTPGVRIRCVMEVGHPPIGPDFDHNFGGVGPYTPRMGETAGQQLARMGTDAREWAREFMNMHHSRGGLNSEVDEELMVGWFASAIETGRTAGQATAPRLPRWVTDRQAADLVYEAIGAASMCWEHVDGAGAYNSAHAVRIGDGLLTALGYDPPSSSPRIGPHAEPTHVVLTQQEWSFLAFHAKQLAGAEMDPRNYFNGPHPVFGGQTLSPEWLTRQERHDRWVAIAEMLEHGTPTRPVTYSDPTETAGQLLEGDVLRDSAGRFYRAGSEVRPSDYRPEERDAVVRQRHLEIFGDEYGVVPGLNRADGIVWPLTLVWR